MRCEIVLLVGAPIGARNSGLSGMAGLPLPAPFDWQFGPRSLNGWAAS